jgi:hypothetical protein
MYCCVAAAFLVCDTTAADGSGGVPVFTGFQIYKGKGAMTVKPVRPKWATTEGGAWKLDKCVCGSGCENKGTKAWV